MAIVFNRQGARQEPILAAPRKRTAFVLSGGGNHGCAQVGMLKALIERGILPDVVVGSSAGAMTGSAIAADPTMRGVEHLAKVWSALRTEDIFPGGKLGRAWSLISGGHHLHPNTGLGNLIDRMAPAQNFSELRVPLRVIATDLCTGEEVVIASGMLKPALLASAALPGLFPPVYHDHRTLVDGGVIDNVPLCHALAGPVDQIFIMNVSGGVADGPVKNPLDVVLRAFAIARNQRFERDLATAPPEVEIVILPRPADRASFDFSGADAVIDEAHGLAADFLDARAAARLPILSAAPPARRRFRRAVAV